LISDQIHGAAHKATYVEKFMIRGRNIFSGISALAIGVVAAQLVAAQAAITAENWPTEPITMLVPFKAGGSIDRLARFLAPALAEELGVPVKVDNRDGGRGQIGYMEAVNGPDDGSVFVLGADPYLSQAILRKGNSYTFDDWSILSVQESDPVSVTVLNGSPFNSLGDVIEAVRKNPDTVTIGVSSGGGPQLQLRAIKSALGNFPYREVTYNGAEYRNALLGGHVDLVLSSASGDLAIKDNIRVLAIASDDSFLGWEDAQSINAALEAFQVTVPYISAIRFAAFRASFKKKHPDRWATFKAAYDRAVNSPDFRAQIIRSGEVTVTRNDPFKNAREMIQRNLEAVREYGAN
jgi:tripartite-type tricarboxylate transporter receptor subunit TctC